MKDLRQTEPCNPGNTFTHLYCVLSQVLSGTHEMEHGSSENTHQTRAFEKGLNFIYSDFQQTYNTNDL